MWLDKYVKEVGMATDYPKFNGKEYIHINLKATDLFLAQFYNGEFNAIDIVVKFLAIENYYKKNDFGFELYRKMQLKRIGEDWTERFIKLIKSFEEGIDMKSRIQTDLCYSIHDGAHRLALALYHGYEDVPVEVFNVEKRRRYYGINWFKENCFSKTEIAIITAKLNELLNKCRKSYFCILWSPARNLFSQITNCLETIESGVNIKEQFEMQFTKDALKDFIYNIYETDDIMKFKLDLKYEHMMLSMESDNYTETLYRVYVIKIQIDNPDFRLKPLSGLPQSRTTMRIKKNIRNLFKDKVTDYYYDIIMHLTDNQLQNDAVEEIIQRANINHKTS